MALTPGTRLGVYEITAQIGEGGMGQVWRATDTTLGRQVAIKILPDAFASDPERLARFEREAKTLASLNHPHIAAIYGFEKSAGMHALVMELVEGEDLSRRIARGPIAIDEALAMAKQIAEALEAAHEQGIIHRDLKPANIKVRDDGTAKVLDFGLAKGVESGAGGQESNSSAITTPAMTLRGVTLGTAAYMAPEQVRGKALDRRADMWAFGVVLYEMLAGQRAFTGDGSTDTMLVVVSQEPDWTALPANTPASIRKLLRRCLEKDRKRRLDSAAGARLEIEDALTVPDGDATAAIAAPAARVRLLPWVLVATLVVALAGALLLWAPWRPAPVLPETRLEIVTPSAEDAASFALSPDGRQIVYLASGEGGSRLWLRSLATTTAQPLAETEDAREPFWSPDSRSIGFFAQGALKRLDLSAGAPRTLAPAVGGRGGTWSADGHIVFAPAASTPLMRVSATGGTAVTVTTVGPQQLGHLYPHFLPDGRRFLFYAQGTPDARGIYLAAMDATTPIRLTPAESGGVFLPSGNGGWLLWGLAGGLVAQRLDLANAVLTGEPLTVAENVEVDGLLRSAVSVAATGLVAFRAGAGSAQQLTWVDRSGKVSGTVGDRDVNNQSNPRVSPDGRRVVVSRTVQGNTDLWLLDGARSSRLTFDAARDDRPAWSPDGTRVVFYSTRTGGGDLYQKLASGAAAEELIPISDQPEVPNSWTTDGRFLLYHRLDAQTGTTDLWVLPMLGAGTPSVFRKTPAREAWGTFSPDNKWVAYYSNESGRTEIYIRPFVPPIAGGTMPEAVGGQWQVSTEGGVFPLWRPDGKELYYLGPSATMMAVPITTTGATLEPGTPAALFRTRIYGGGVDLQLGRQYDVGPGGRFLINAELADAAPPITLLMNWRPEGRK